MLLFKGERRILLKTVTWLLITVPECMSLQGLCLCIYGGRVRMVNHSQHIRRKLGFIMANKLIFLWLLKLNKPEPLL